MRFGRLDINKIFPLLLLAAVFPVFSACSVVELAGDVVVLTGKVAVTAVKTTGAVVVATGKIAGAAVGATVRYFKGKETVKLEREGDSYIVRAKINGKKKARLILDTGATSVQISPKLAKKLGIKVSKGEQVMVTLADGSSIAARLIVLDEVRLDDVRVNDVQALVIEGSYEQDTDGLLGMSFLNNFIFQIDPDKNLLILECKPR